MIYDSGGEVSVLGVKSQKWPHRRVMGYSRGEVIRSVVWGTQRVLVDRGIPILETVLETFGFRNRVSKPVFESSTF